MSQSDRPDRTTAALVTAEPPSLSDVPSATTPSDTARADTTVRVSICTMCNDRRRGGMRAGRLLLADLVARPRDARVEIVAIECMSVCRPLITVSFTAEGKWAHVFAVPSDIDPADVLEGARLYANSRTGLFPWRRCETLQKGVVARVPPASPSRHGAH